MSIGRSLSCFAGGEKSDPFGEPERAFFNPFRNRKPEDAAAAFLALVKAGRCDEAMKTLSATTTTHQEYLCAKELEHPFESAKLKNRHDEGDKVRLFYWHWRTDIGGPGRLWMTVENRGGDWNVIDYECIY